jgi:hypothetical protein
MVKSSKLMGVVKGFLPARSIVVLIVRFASFLAASAFAAVANRIPSLAAVPSGFSVTPLFILKPMSSVVASDRFPFANLTK